MFLLVFLEGFTCREVGEMLDIPLGTVLSRIHRARSRLRHLLKHMAPDSGAQGSSQQGSSQQGSSQQGSSQQGSSRQASEGEG